MKTANSTPHRAKCVECGHEWVALWLPMAMWDASQVLGSLRCPSCAAPPQRIVTAPGKADSAES